MGVQPLFNDPFEQFHDSTYRVDGPIASGKGGDFVRLQ